MCQRHIAFTILTGILAKCLSVIHFVILVEQYSQQLE